MPDRPISYPWSPEESRERVRRAVAEFWRARDAAGAAQREKGVVDAGTRGDVTAGKHLDAFVKMMVEVISSSGFQRSEIHFGNRHRVPGYFRAQKTWDLVVIRDRRLHAAIEFKSQVGSFGNNLNNRTEEALGTSLDLWTAFREGTLGPHRPWVGYFMVVQEHPKARSQVGHSKSPLGVREEFIGSSYIDRYVLLCERMMLESQYSSAALIVAPRETPGDFAEPSRSATAEGFMRSLFGHLVGAGA